MSNIKLTYFDFSDGRGEPARLALHLGGIEFEDFRFPINEFSVVRDTTPLKQVPTLTVDGKQITQSNAINRYVGKLAGLYPDDNMQALLCDEIMEALEDVTQKLVVTFSLSGEEQKNARQALVDGPLTQYLHWIEARLQEQGGEFFVENRLTMADLKVLVWIRSLNSGHLDHIPTTLVEQVAPKLQQHHNRLIDIPAIAKHYS